ncbi:hypothetical protein FNV43_RR15618 [Rhamnella rubrinervis]|uniref:Growth-regulating factor n=1 Tax=Rhamnella rubrinervis TaxID=2594499 RepID=A0A8K0GXJ3_9ROSA|nr:hypothetical protein FNV43_RR15618 [Rhamnella rubrinervis]
MDFHLKQWRKQHESEQQHSAKMPKLLLEPHQQPEPSAGSALPLFVPEPNSSKISSLSAFSEPTPASTRFTRIGSHFSLAQWQELELQVLIFRYMLAGAAVPQELLQSIKKSLMHTPCFLRHPLQHYPHYQPALFQTGYWGRAAMDPEPGRCRRTDGKKWRCSRDVVAGQKYCERHMHRGRNRSRKPVENPTSPTTTSVAGGGGNFSGPIGNGGGGTPHTFTNSPIAIANAVPHLPTSSGGTLFALSGPSSSIDLLHLNQSSSESRTENKDLFEPNNEVSGDGKSDGHILRHFFDDWPRSLPEADSRGGSIASPMNSATSLSISIPGNSSSDVSLKLSTGDGDEPGHQEGHAEREQPQLNWAAGWAMNRMASMGGPLAEALRSSNSHSSPTSVLHQLSRGSVSETSFVST